MDSGVSLPAGWEETVAEAAWPDTLVAAVRWDVSVLALPRVQRTLAEWQTAARDAEIPTQRRAVAKRYLKQVSEALLLESPGPAPEITSRLASAHHKLPSRASPPPTGFEADDEAAVRSRPPSFERRPPSLSAQAPRGPGTGQRSAIIVAPLVAEEAETEETATLDRRRLASLSSAASAASRSSAAKPAPPPGAVQQRPSPGQILALLPRVRPLAQEIVALPIERRAIRFWARWRETSGDRPVAREPIEAVLREAETAEDFCAGIVAAIQGLDTDMVREVLHEIGEQPAASSAPRPPPPSSGAQVVHASTPVRVEPVKKPSSKG